MRRTAALLALVTVGFTATASLAGDFVRALESPDLTIVDEGAEQLQPVPPPSVSTQNATGIATAAYSSASAIFL
jgi:hypothetical protein